MKIKQILPDSILFVAVLVLLVLLVNPYMLWMPSGLEMMMVAGLIVVVVVLIGYVWREQARDERESLNRLIATRLGYTIGLLGLLVGVVVQIIQHDVDVWLISGLVVMVLGKLIGNLYVELRK